MEAEGSSDNEKLRSGGSPKGIRQRNQTEAELGDAQLTQAAGNGIACRAEKRPSDARTTAGQGTRFSPHASSAAPSRARAEIPSNTGMCTVPIASAEPR